MLPWKHMNSISECDGKEFSGMGLSELKKKARIKANLLYIFMLLAGEVLGIVFGMEVL